MEYFTDYIRSLIGTNSAPSVDKGNAEPPSVGHVWLDGPKGVNKEYHSPACTVPQFLFPIPFPSFELWNGTRCGIVRAAEYYELGNGTVRQASKWYKL